MTALGVGTMAFAHSWLPAGGAPLRAGLVGATMALLGSCLLYSFGAAPRWWFGTVAHGWIKVDGQWFFTGESDVSVD